MSDDSDDASLSRGPRETSVLFGHDEAERFLLDSYRSGQMPHAWLIGGAHGIGKATLAFRLARFVFAHPDPASAAVRDAKDLSVPADDPVARRVATAGHSDLLVLERRLNDKGKLSQNIAVDDVRRTVSFFGSTAGEGGWRIAIIDKVDDLQREGANALLKILEEPPARSLLLLVCDAPMRTLATIRSRCRRLLLRPLDEADVARALGAALDRAAGSQDIRAAAAAAEGSVARALDMLEGDTRGVRDKTLALLAQLPNPDPRALHTLGDAISGAEAAPLSTVVEVAQGWLSERLEQSVREGRDALRLADAWERLAGTARDVETYNLDRKPFIFSLFGLLAEASRG